MEGINEQRDIDRVPSKLHVHPQFYCVYLLQSQAKPGSFYIGSTPDPVRRLKQHNGQLINGAFRTRKKGYRPWDMVLVVHNFPSKIAALQFEHSFQHPHRTRHILANERVTKNAQTGRGLHHKLANLRLLVSCNFFRRMGLEINIFKDAIYDAWQTNKFGIETPGYVEVKFGDYKDFVGIDANTEDKDQEGEQGPRKEEHEYFELCKRKLLIESHNCFICEQFLEFHPFTEKAGSIAQRKHERLKLEAEILPAVCYQCHTVCHILCLADLFLNGQEIIPVEGKCPKCSRILKWSKISKSATILREHALKDRPEVV